jgi:hypothetical protein
MGGARKVAILKSAVVLAKLIRALRRATVAAAEASAMPVAVARVVVSIDVAVGVEEVFKLPVLKLSVILLKSCWLAVSTPRAGLLWPSASASA